MPLYDFRCATGHRFEQQVPLSESTVPACPNCGRSSVKLQSAGRLLGRASAGLSQDQMPQTWKGTYNGNPEYIRGLRRTWADRQRLEAKYPEIAGDQRPVLAHEGRYHDAPLRQGDVDLGGHGHSHGHSHGEGHGHSHAPAPAAAPAAPAAPSPAASAKPSTSGT